MTHKEIADYARDAAEMALEVSEPDCIPDMEEAVMFLIMMAEDNDGPEEVARIQEAAKDPYFRQVYERGGARLA